MISVGISQKELGESDAEMFKILPRDWNLKPILSIFTQKWASVDMNWGPPPQPTPLTIPTLR